MLNLFIIVYDIVMIVIWTLTGFGLFFIILNIVPVIKDENKKWHWVICLTILFCGLVCFKILGMHVYTFIPAVIAGYMALKLF